MDIDKLRRIFDNYIRKFDIINVRPGHDENYKWRLAAQFPALMNPDAPNFVAGMKEVKKISQNLIDSYTWPLQGLIRCAEKDEDAVRNLFRELFADDNGDLSARQDKIDTFKKNANALIGRTQGRIGRMQNDQRSAMAYLFFHDPEHHYLYKYKQANKFAKCAEFPDSWWGRTFKLDVYYRMCDELVKAIKGYEPLLETTRRRYHELPLKEDEKIHPDENYHILAFDIIWGTGIDDSADYNFGEGTESLNPYETVHSEKMEEITPPPPAASNF